MCYNEIMSTVQDCITKKCKQRQSLFKHPFNFLSSSLSKFIIDLKTVSIVLLRFILFALMQIYLVTIIPFNQKWRVSLIRFRLNTKTCRDRLYGCPHSDLGIISPSSASTYFFSKFDFTDTPVLRTDDTLGYFSRDVDGTFMGEWGNLFAGYSGSKFDQKNVVWTKDIFNINKHFVVHTADGDQSYLPLTDHNVVVVCSN